MIKNLIFKFLSFCDKVCLADTGAFHASYGASSIKTWSNINCYRIKNTMDTYYI